MKRKETIRTGWLALVAGSALVTAACGGIAGTSGVGGKAESTGPSDFPAIYAGAAQGSSYTNDFCPAVQEAMLGPGFEHECTPSQGSWGNVGKIGTTQGAEHVALTQMDVAGLYESQNPGTIQVIRPDARAAEPKVLECLFGVTARGRITSLSRIRDGARVLLPGPNSGSAKTFEYLISQGVIPPVEVRNVDGGALALVNELNANPDSYDLAFFVQFADTSNEVFKVVNGSDNLNFIPMLSRNLMRLEINGQRVYEGAEVTVTPADTLGQIGNLIGADIGKDAAALKTACTPLVLATGSADRYGHADDYNDTITALQAAPRPSDPKWAQILGNVRSMAGGLLDSALEQIDKL